MRDQLTREEKLRIAAEADQIHGTNAFPCEEQIEEVDAALSGEWSDADWYDSVRWLANAATTDKLTPSERATVERLRTYCTAAGDGNDGPAILAIIDRLAPKVAP